MLLKLTVKCNKQQKQKIFREEIIICFLSRTVKFIGRHIT